MNLLESPLVIGILGALLGGILTILGGIIGVWLQARHSRKAEELKQKQDVFRRFFGSRYRFLGDSRTPIEPYTSFNEIAIVFADSPDVISALNKFHGEMGRQDLFHDNLTTLVEALATATNIPDGNLTHDFINRPIRLRE